MVACPNCGIEVQEGAKFCKECGAKITVENVIEDKFCSNCGFEIPKGSKFCPECGTPIGNVPIVANNINKGVVNSAKSPGFAAVLSFLIIGLGQVYLGLTKKGIILFVLALISGVLMLLFIGWITWLIIWGYSIYDAYNSGQKMQNGIPVEDRIDLDNLF